MKFDITSHVVQNHYKKLTTFIGLRYSLDGRTATDLHRPSQYTALTLTVGVH